MGKQPDETDIKLARSAYIRYRTWRYMLEHPATTADQARRFAGKMWNKKMHRWQEHGFIEVSNK